jgi:hypothetical protein
MGLCWAESGPMDSTQLAQWTEVHNTSLGLAHNIQKGLVGFFRALMGWSTT